MGSYLSNFRQGKVDAPSGVEILSEADPDAKKGLATEKLRSLVALSLVEPENPAVRTITGWGKQLNDLLLLLGGGEESREILFHSINDLDEISRALLLSRISMSKRFEILKVGLDQVNEREMAFFLNMAVFLYNRSGNPGDLEEILITTVERDQSAEPFNASEVIESILENYPEGSGYIFKELMKAAEQMDFSGHLSDFFLSHAATLRLAHRLEEEDETDNVVPWNRRL
jgi:hypothetical protein